MVGYYLTDDYDHQVNFRFNDELLLEVQDVSDSTAPKSQFIVLDKEQATFMCEKILELINEPTQSPTETTPGAV